MTIDEVLAKLPPSATLDSGYASRAEIRADLCALVYGESVRAAVMLRETANSDEVTSMCCSDDTGNLLDALAANILSTSPGQLHEECPDCDGCGRHADPTADVWCSDSSDECGRCEGRGHIISTSPGKVGG